MFNKPFDLIMFNMSSFSEWEKGVANRNRFILKNLLESGMVRKALLVDFFPFTLKRTIRNGIENILFGTKGKVIFKNAFSRCVLYSNKEFLNQPVYIYSTISSYFSKKRYILELQALIKQIGIEEGVLWSYHPMFVEYFPTLEKKISIFDAVDNWCENKDFLQYRNTLKKNYQYIAQHADIIFTVSEKLVDFFKSLGRNESISWIPNGVELSFFIKKQTSLQLQSVFKRISKPIIGYIGTLQTRVDFPLLCLLAKKHPEFSFVLAGPQWPVHFRKFRPVPKDLQELKKLKNVFFIGQIPYQFAPYVIDQFDVALIPHRLDSFVGSMNPMKMYDYLALGKPIVATNCAGLDTFLGFVSIAKNSDEFEKFMLSSLSHDSEELQKKRKELVMAHTYQSRVKQMLEIILQKL